MNVKIENNSVNLCDSCEKDAETCDAYDKDYLPGDCDTNICCCSKYAPLMTRKQLNDGPDNNVGTKLSTNLAEVGTDCISRQAAIDYFVTNVGFHDEDGYPIEDTDELRKIWTEYFSGIQPAEPEPCEDAVSREVLKDGFTEMCNLICPYTKKQQHVMCGSCLMGTAFDVLEATPSVTPKQRTGKWIDVDDHYNRISGRCSVCGWEALLYETDVVGMDFCPNCGADMRGEQDE